MLRIARRSSLRRPVGVLLATVTALSLGFLAPALSVAAQLYEIHYAPTENLERIDVDLIGTARTSIDLAAFSLTSWAVIDALVQAHDRGVAVHVLLDRTQKQAWERLAPIMDAVRVKPGGPYMHLKSYAIDGEILRTGSANFSPSGLKQQDNDLVVIRDAEQAQAFRARLQGLWGKGRPASSDMATPPQAP